MPLPHPDPSGKPETIMGATFKNDHRAPCRNRLRRFFTILATVTSAPRRNVKPDAGAAEFPDDSLAGKYYRSGMIRSTLHHQTETP
jgi:hypothetical protein